MTDTSKKPAPSLSAEAIAAEIGVPADLASNVVESPIKELHVHGKFGAG